MASSKTLQAIVEIAGSLSPTLGKAAEEASKSLEGINLKAVAVGAGVAAAGAAIGKATIEAGKYLVDLGGQFDNVVDTIRIGTGATGDALDALPDDFNEVYKSVPMSAMRYAMGRNTCMPVVVSDYIKRHLQLLDDKFLVLAADEIRRYLEDYAEHEPNPNLWHDLLGALETEQRERATRKARKIRLCPACGKPLEVMSIADNRHSPGGFDVIAHCRNCLSDYEWFCDKDGGVSDMKQYFFG